MLGVALLGFSVNGVAVVTAARRARGQPERARRLSPHARRHARVGRHRRGGGGHPVHRLARRRSDRVARDDGAHHRWRVALVRESVDVLLEAAPAHIALDTVRKRLETIGFVESIHDLHVWTVTSGMVAMSVHAVVRDSANHQAVLEQAHDVCLEMGIQHSTIQLECEDMGDRELHLHP